MLKLPKGVKHLNCLLDPLIYLQKKSIQFDIGFIWVDNKNNRISLVRLRKKFMA